MPAPRTVPPGLMTKSGYAAHRQCSQSYISKLIREGRLAAPALLDNGLINVALADQMLGEPALLPDPASVPDAPPAPETPRSRPAVPETPTGRQRREEAQAALAELELQKRQGDLLPREAVIRAVEMTAARAKGRVMRVPEEVAVSLLAMTDAAQIVACLTERLTEAFAAINEEFLADAERHAE